MVRTHLTKFGITALLILISASNLYAANQYKTRQNPFTGKPDFVLGTDNLEVTNLIASNTITGIAVSLEGGTYDTYLTAGTPTSSVYYILPPADGTSGQVLHTSGSGVLSWDADDSGAGGGDPILIDGTGITDASGVDLIGGTTGIDITLNAAVSPDTATFGVDLTEITCGTNLTCSAATTINVDDASSFATSVTSPIFSSNNADPADAGIVRLGNAENIAWEASPAGTDVTLSVDASEILQSSAIFGASQVYTDNVRTSGGGTLTLNNYTVGDVQVMNNLIVGTTDPADAGAVRLENAANIAWEASPAGTDCTLGIDASEILQSSCAVTVTGTMAATTVTGANVTSGANPGHTHTGTSLSGIDISDDTNLAGDTENVLTGDALSIGAAITRDAEWDTEGEVQTAWGAVNILLETEIDASSELLALMDDETGTGALVFGTSPTFTTDITFPAGSIEAGAYGAATIDGDDVNSNIAGRSLTLTATSPDTLDADAELYTDTKCIWFEDPVAADDFKSIWYAKTACTITSLWCESDQVVTAMLQVDDGTPADVDTVDLTCDSTPPEDTSLDGDATMASGERLDLDVASVASTPTWVSICWTFTYDD